MKRYKSIKQKFQELTLSDLSSDQGMSSLTTKFKKERNKLLGAESRIAKLIDVEIDETARYITFIWLTEVTPKYPDNYKYGEVDIEGDKEIELNRSKTYELKIRIMNFFDWLDTYPEKIEITENDIKDIFDVSDIKVSSNDPSWHWQGMNFYMSQIDGSIYPTKVPAPVWGPRHNTGDALLSKHLQSLINGIDFWKSPMASMLTKKLKQRKLI